MPRPDRARIAASPEVNRAIRPSSPGMARKGHRSHGGSCENLPRGQNGRGAGHRVPRAESSVQSVARWDRYRYAMSLRVALVAVNGPAKGDETSVRRAKARPHNGSMVAR